MLDYVVCETSSAVPRNSEGDLVALKDGTLLLVWTEFYGGFKDYSPARIAMKTSKDGGETWSPATTLVNNEGKQNVMSVSLLRTASGALLLFYMRKNSGRDLATKMLRSDDEGKTWRSKTTVTQGGYNILNNARVIQTSTGRILVPVAHSEETGQDSRVLCYYSDDEGKTWVRGHDTGLEDETCQEPGVVDLGENKVLMTMRTRLDYVYFALSNDGGQSWSRPYPSTLSSPLSPATMAKIGKQDDLLIVWNNNPKGGAATWKERTPLTAAISRDHGQSWGNIKDIETDPEHCYAYTSITPIGEYVYLTYYYWKLQEDVFANTSLKLRRIPVAWFYEESD